MLKYYRWEKFEDANGVIRRQKSKTDNTMAKKKKKKKANYGPRNTTQKTKVWATWAPPPHK
jgi:hypothetical protein